MTPKEKAAIIEEAKKHEPDIWSDEYFPYWEKVYAQFEETEEKEMSEKFDQAAYIQRYNKQNYARVCLQVPPKVKDEWQTKARAEGMSLTAWLISKTKD